MKKLAIVPNDSDDVVTLTDHRDHFRRLSSVNVSLTNKCNLQCRYCYEQHKREYGKYEVEDVKKVYDFLLSINEIPKEEKNLVFFGGEPLLKKDLILEFLHTHKPQCNVAIVSNCLLLTEEFIDEYFKFPNTRLVMSIDTFDSTIDQRQIPQEKLNQILRMIDYIPKTIKEANRVVVRPTVSYQTAPTLTGFLETLYEHGIRSYIVQPLVMGNLEGFINWGDDEWKKLTSDTIGFLRKHSEIQIEVTEGVGKRSEGSNCLSNYDIISIDASGDFSGCYFFVNQKEKAGSLLSGNIFQNKLYINREQDFTKQYKEMFTAYEECRTCDLQDHCYQCPAGNLDTGGKLYRPDSMCKRFVQFYFDINNEIFKIRYRSLFQSFLVGTRMEGENFLKKKLIQYMNKETNLGSLSKEELSVVLQHDFDHLVKSYSTVLNKGTKYETIFDVVDDRTNETATFDELFGLLVKRHGIFVKQLDDKRMEEVDRRLFQLTILGVSVYE